MAYSSIASLVQNVLSNLLDPNLLLSGVFHKISSAKNGILEKLWVYIVASSVWEQFEKIAFWNLLIKNKQRKIRASSKIENFIEIR